MDPLTVSVPIFLPRPDPFLTRFLVVSLCEKGLANVPLPFFSSFDLLLCPLKNCQQRQKNLDRKDLIPKQLIQDVLPVHRNVSGNLVCIRFFYIYFLCSSQTQRHMYELCHT